jgi:hypothetical protein
LQHAVWDIQQFLLCNYWWPSRSGNVTHRTGFLEFLNQLSHCIAMWHLGLWNCAWNHCWTSCVYSPPHRNTCCTRNVRCSVDNTIITTHILLASPHYLAESDCLAADRQGQEDTRLTLTPSVAPNSNDVIMVSDWNCLKYFCMFFTLIIRCTETFHHPVYLITFRIFHK